VRERLNERLRIGFVLSAGGSAFAEAVKASAHLPVDFIAVTDRACGGEEKCAALGVPATRIVADDPRTLSSKIAEHFQARGVQAVVLHFSRLVTPELHDVLPCYNIHPSLLPAFPGMTGLQQARAGGVRLLGATAHVVDAGVDSGRILAQAVVPVPPRADEAWWNRASFLQKSLITLVLIEILFANRTGSVVSSAEDAPHSRYVNPPLRDERTREAFRQLQRQHAITVLDP